MTNATIHGSTLHITKTKTLEVGAFISTCSPRYYDECRRIALEAQR